MIVCSMTALLTLVIVQHPACTKTDETETATNETFSFQTNAGATLIAGVLVVSPTRIHPD